MVIASSARDEKGDAPVDPSDRVAGLSVLMRAVLTLQDRGVEWIGIVGGDRLVDDLRADPRVSTPLEAVRGPLSARALVTRAHHVVSPKVFDQLLSSAKGRVAIAGEHGVGPAVLDAGDDGLPATDAADVRWLEPEDFVHDASSARGRRAATRSLFEACRKPVDGVVSRHLNRRVSLFLSRMLVDTPVTPNAMTFVTFAVAVAASWLALDGTYASFAAAGVLMQLNSILDGCDGELARVRFQRSTLGQWLDTVADDLSNVMFWAAVGYGARHVPEWGPWLARAGWLAAGAHGLSALLNYVVLARKGSGDFYALLGADVRPEEQPGPLVAFFGTVLRQDFFLFVVMIVALAGWLPWALPVLALGAVITLGVSLTRTTQFFSRTAGSPSARRTGSLR